MRIGILTYWTSNDNYGQLLQCYALQCFLKKQGHQPFLVKYAPKDKISFFSRSVALVKKIITNLSIQGIKYHFSDERKINKKKEHAELSLVYENNILNKERKFDLFRANHIEQFPRLYTSFKELKDNPPEVDALICGSDQVWHSSNLNPNTPGWFLNFGESSIKRISYAASIGHDLTGKELKYFKKNLSKLDAISVREDSVRHYCESVGYNAYVTADPTLLLQSEDYNFDHNQNNESFSYMFMYVLNVKTSQEIYWDKISPYLKQNDLKFKIVVSSGYCPAREIIPNEKNIMATIPQWISLIKQSKCIVTTSYHGVLFSIIMRKPFIAIPLQGPYSSSNIRIDQILHKLDLSNRIYNPNISFAEQMDSPINWMDVEIKLNDLTAYSSNFLLNNLKS